MVSAVISPTSQAKAPVYTIVVSEKGGTERREIFERAELSVGRVQGNDLMLPKGNVSKRHARLLYRDGRFIVTDLNSTNGTYVNRRRISQATIVREGDRIYIGDFVLTIVLGGEGSAEAIAAEEAGSGPVAASPEPLEPVEASAQPGTADEGYPPLPAAPRLPLPSGHSHEPSVESHSSSRSRGSAPEPSRPSAERISVSLEERIDPQVQAHRDAVNALVTRVASEQPSGALERTPDEATVRRVEQSLRDHASSLAREGVALDRVVSDARAELLELGSLTLLLADAEIREISVARFDQVEASRGAKSERIEPPFSSEQSLRRVVLRLCERAGQPLASIEHVVERQLPDGVRVSAILGRGAAGGTLVVLRRPHRIVRSFEDLVRRGTVSRAIATFLSQCVSARANILVTGPHDAGRAHVMSALCAAAGDGRIVALQDVDDVVVQPSATRFSLAETGVDTSGLLRIASRMSDARLVVEMSTGDIMAASIEVIAEGADAVVAAMRAPTLRRALSRLAAELSGHRAGLGLAAAREWVAGAFDIAIEVSEMRDGRERVLHVAELVGSNDEEIRMQDVFTFAIERTAAGGAVEGTFSASGVVPRIVDEMSARGVSIETSLFSRPPSR